MTLHDDHGTLPAQGLHLLARLETLEQLNAPALVGHMQHMDYVKRAQQLAAHLRSVVLLVDAAQYPSALVVVRAALEHHLMDRLLFLARLYVETYGGIKRNDVPAEYARLAALKASSRPDISRWWWDESGMNVVIRGLHSTRATKGRGQIISPYYFRQDQFDPFTGGKKHAADLASPFWRKKYRKEWANEAASAWRHWFVHEKVMKALRVNRLLSRVAVHVDIHYAFLSGFVHPTKRAYEAVYSRNFPDRLGVFDHYASELCLLYVVTLAAAELDIYGRMARRPPRLAMNGWDTVEQEVREARLASSYFWFLGDGPTMIDRIDTVHTPPGRSDPKVGRPKVDPATLPDERVRYYADPLDRLVRLHRTEAEMTTGLVFRSPFERSDARFR